MGGFVCSESIENEPSDGFPLSPEGLDGRTYRVRELDLSSSRNLSSTGWMLSRFHESVDVWIEATEATWALPACGGAEDKSDFSMDRHEVALVNNKIAKKRTLVLLIV
jgi:hypothetical protein